MGFSDTEIAADPLGAFRKNDQRPAPVIIDDADVTYPHAMTEAGTHGLHRRFLAGEVHGEKSHRPFTALEQCPLLRHQQPLDEPFPEALVGFLHTADFDY